MLWKLFGRTHGRTDTRTDGQGKHYIPPTSLKRGYKYEFSLMAEANFHILQITLLSHARICKDF